MTRVRFHHSHRVAGRDFQAGDVADMPPKRAEWLVERGIAEPYEPPRSRTKRHTQATETPEVP